VLGPHRWAVQVQQAIAFEHAVDDRGGEIVVMKDGAPCAIG
jgi:hypothetical protein